MEAPADPRILTEKSFFYTFMLSGLVPYRTKSSKRFLIFISNITVKGWKSSAFRVGLTLKMSKNMPLKTISPGK